MRGAIVIGRFCWGVAIIPVAVSVGMFIGLGAAVWALFTLPFVLLFEVVSEMVMAVKQRRHELDALQLDFPGVFRGDLLDARRTRMLKERAARMSSDGEASGRVQRNAGPN